MEELMTEKEKAILRKREEIAAALRAGLTYRQIEDELSVSTSTISLVNRLMTTKQKRRTKWR